MSRKLALNAVVSLAGCFAFWRFVAVPLHRLLHRGVRPHGTLEEDPDFYYHIIATCLIRFGGALGVTFCLLAIGCALGTPLGFAVKPADRATARTWLWYVPIFFFSLELIGRFQAQRWYVERHGIIFPFTSFLSDFVGSRWQAHGEGIPHLWWLLAAMLLTAPAIFTGRGLWHFLSPPTPAPQPPA